VISFSLYGDYFKKDNMGFMVSMHKRIKHCIQNVGNITSWEKTSWEA
jgi:hypothetical protein